MTLHLSPGAPGQGGLGRGRADAPMVWGDESDEQSVRFDTKVLPPDMAGLEDSQLFGLGRSAPETLGQGEAAGLQAVDGSPGSAVTRRRLSPRHRRAVGRFFGSSAKDK